MSGALTLIIPVLFFVTVAQLTRAKGPQWLPYTFENSYHYLFNALLMLEGKPSPYTNHPGTTTLTFGAVILRASTLKSADALVESSLKDPEKPIKLLQRTLLIFTAAMLWIAPWITAVVLRNNIAALLVQAPVLFFQLLLYWGIVFGPELMDAGFGVVAVCCCVLLLFPSSVSDKNIVLALADRSAMGGSARLRGIPVAAVITGLIWILGILVWNGALGIELMNVGVCVVAACWLLLMLRGPGLDKTIIFNPHEKAPIPGLITLIRIPLVAFVTGVLCAFGIVTKLIFFPLVLISLFCCRTPRNLVSFGVAFVLGLAFCLAPIYSQLPDFIGSTFNVGVHSGVYGSGSLGWPELNVYWKSLIGFYGFGPLFVIIPAVVTVVVTLFSIFGNGRQDTQQVTWRTVVPIFGLQLVSYCIIAKGFFPRYLFPLWLSVGLNLVLLFYAFQITSSIPKRVLGLVVLLSLLFLGIKDYITQTPDAYQGLRSEQDEQRSLYEHAKELTKDDVRIDYLFSVSPEYPLWSANLTTGHAFSSLLTKLYPKAPLFYNYSSNELETFTGPLDTDAELQKHDHLYFLGNPPMFPRLKGISSGDLETIETAGNYSLQKWTRKR